MDLTINFIQTQLTLLAAEGYRITLMSPSNTLPALPTYNLGKGKGNGINPLTGMVNEKLFNMDEVISHATVLKKKNAIGYNVFLTPFSSEYRYLLIDDVRTQELPEPLIRPTQLIQSSPASRQAVYRLPASWFCSHSHIVAVFNNLNRQYGDPKISGATHPFRMRGFTNRKTKYKNENGQFPFVREVSNYDGDQPDSLRDLIHNLRTDKVGVFLSNSEAKPGGISLADVAIPQPATIIFDADEPTPQDLVFAYRWYDGAAYRYGDNLDLSKVDFVLAGKMLKYNKSPGQVALTLRRCSPRITARHPDIERYLRKVVSSAARYLEN